MFIVEAIVAVQRSVAKGKGPSQAVLRLWVSVYAIAIGQCLVSGMTGERAGANLHSHYIAVCNLNLFLDNGQTLFGVNPSTPGVSGNSRSRPFPGIPTSYSRSQKLGMIFSFPFPFPKVGNAIFHSRSQNLGMQFSIPVPVTGNGLSKSGIEREWSSKVESKKAFN